MVLKPVKGEEPKTSIPTHLEHYFTFVRNKRGLCYVWVIPGQEGFCTVSGSPVLISSQAANCAHRAGCSGICGFIALREVYWNLFLVISLFRRILGLFHVSQYYHTNHFGAGFLSCFNDSSDLLTFSIYPNKTGLYFFRYE